ncbi:MAG: hypothetical protein L6277_14735 [Desulfobacterales bacterium]|nr:hypothetical protein [Pseudomonadota bacterium]MBU4355978.1 hypothetical protein [Pseudomonadota bacterium]MCG2773331.1 hypothetical protein [Desulfobacterales bacterium]
MARRKAKVGAAQKLTGYGILAVLGLIMVGLLIQQSRFNPAVIVAMSAPEVKGRPQAVAAPALAATAALIPEVDGFTPLVPTQSFGPDNLSDKIDGKAELYLSAGFKEMSCRSFGLGGSGGAHVEVLVYDMGSAPNAYAVFSGQRRSGSPTIPLTANAYATGNALFFTQGKFYVEIVADRASETLQKSLEAYATALLAKLPSQGEAKDAAALFPKEGLARETVRLCAADTFGCEGLNNMLTGEYSLKAGKATAFVAVRDTPEQAQAETRRYLDFLAANGYQKVPAPGAPGNIDVLGLDNSFEMVFVQGRILAGVHDATSIAAALELAAQLRAGLKGKP